MTQPSVRVGIVGAGIGGLSLALALRERGVQAGHCCVVASLKSVGARSG